VKYLKKLTYKEEMIIFHSEIWRLYSIDQFSPLLWAYGEAGVQAKQNHSPCDQKAKRKRKKVHYRVIQSASRACLQ
jgi:hypothetical protein